MKTIGSAQQPTEAQSEMAELSQLIPWEKEAEKHVQEVEMEETEARGSQETEDHRLHREYIDTTMCPSTDSHSTKTRPVHMAEMSDSRPRTPGTPILKAKVS